MTKQKCPDCNGSMREYTYAFRDNNVVKICKYCNDKHDKEQEAKKNG